MLSWRRRTALALCLLLGACGLRPMYGAQGTQADAGLNRIEISTIEGRVGQRLRNQLMDRFYAGGRAEDTEYRLDVRLNVVDNLFDDTLESAQLANSVTVHASYQLRDRSGRAMHVGSASTVIYKSPVSGQFALFVNQQDAYGRAIDQVADDLTRRISLFLTREPT